MRLVQPPVALGPGRWLLPRLPAGHAAALHRLAVDCRELEAVLATVARDAQWVIVGLRRDWRGRGAAAAPRPLEQLVHDAATVRRSLTLFADELDRLAVAVQRASDRHDWSWRKVATVSAVVAVTAGAFVVTVGSAGTAAPGAAAAEAAVVSAAAGEMAAASAAAAAAEVAAGEGLLAAARLARAVRALRAVVVPRLTTAVVHAPVWLETPVGGAAVGAGTTVGLEWLDDGRVAWGDAGLAAVLGAGESYVLSPGRSRGYLELTPRRLASMQVPGRRRELLRINRAIYPQDERPLRFETEQLRTHHKHAPVFGVSRAYNRQTSADFRSVLSAFVSRPSTVRIDGAYNGRDALFFADYDTRQVVICHLDGSFWTALELGPEQQWHLWHTGTLGGR
jgi:hypothetical protein